MILFILTLLLFCVGIYGVFFKRNLIKVVIGFVIIEYAINCMFVLIGYRKDGASPIFDLSKDTDVLIVDPLPQALVLTAIVIGLGTTALLVSIAVRIYQRYGTFDLREIRKLRG